LLQVHPENLSTQTDEKALASMQILVLQPAPQRNDNSRLKVHDMPLPDQPGEDRPPRKQSIKEKIKQVTQSKEFEGAKAHTTSWVCRDPHFLPLRSAWWLPVLQRLTTATASRCRCDTPTAKERRNLLGFGYMSIIFRPNGRKLG
jgi:hypothetical protein